MRARGGLPLWVGGGGLALVTVAALAIGGGDVVVALAPLMAVGFLYLLWRSPVRHTAFGVLAACLFLDSTSERPYEGLWQHPTRPLAKLFYENLSNSTGIKPLRFSGLEALLALMLVLLALRRANGSKVDPPTPPTSRYFRAALLLSAGAIVFAELWGIARGGDTKESIWQMRVLLAVPAAVAIFARVLRGPEDYRKVGNIVVAAALYKATMSFYAYFFIFRPMGIVPGYVTTHTDTVTYAMAIAILLSRWVERPGRRQLVHMALCYPWIGVGLITNDRRLAWVTIAACALTIFLVAPWNRAKRMVARALILSLPIWAAYVAVGWGSRTKIFKPVQQMRTMVAGDTGDEESQSSEFRDLENYNLIFTFGQSNPLIGRGFGHEYIEAIMLPDISRFMPNYRYLPHNTVLWMWGIFGALGFTALFLYLGLGMFFAARGYHWAHGWVERSSCLTAICAAIAYLNQAFGDMGVQSYTSVMNLAPWLAVAAQQAIVTGAFRDPALARKRRPLPAPSPRATALP